MRPAVIARSRDEASGAETNGDIGWALREAVKVHVPKEKFISIKRRRQKKRSGSKYGVTQENRASWQSSRHQLAALLPM